MGRFSDVRRRLLSERSGRRPEAMKFTRRTFVALAGAAPASGLTSSLAFSERPRVVATHDAFSFELASFAFKVDRRWFDDAPRLLVSESDDQFTVSIPALRLKRSPISGFLNVWIGRV